MQRESSLKVYIVLCITKYLALFLDWVNFQRKECFHFCFAPFPMGSTPFGKNLLLQKQILPYMSRPDFSRNTSLRKANKKSQKLSFLCKNVDETFNPFDLNVLLFSTWQTWTFYFFQPDKQNQRCADLDNTAQYELSHLWILTICHFYILVNKS